MVSAPAFARTITKLYIAGGTTSAAAHVNIPQFMFLDLLVPFNSTAPAWTQLANCPPQRNFPAAFSSDEKILYIFHVPDTNSPWKYSVADNAWQEVTAAKFGNAGWEGIGAVTDPKSGLIFLAGGYDDINLRGTAMKIFNTFDPVSETIHTDALPPPERVFPIRWSYGNVWSKNRSSIIYWGGVNRDSQVPISPVENGVTEFSPDLMGWYTMLIQGVAPEVRTNHCMAANDDGTKVAIYGGWVRNGTVVGELWILDVIAYTWIQGKSGPPRIYCACTIAGDQLLIWGGSSASTVMAPSEMLIYNFASSEYVKEYTPPAYYKDLSPPHALRRVTAPWPTKTPTGGADAGSGGVENGATREETNSAIVGGVVGGLALLGAFAGIIFLGWKQRQREKQKSTETTGSNSTQNNDGEVAESVQWKGPQGVATSNEPQATEQHFDYVDRTLQELVEQQRQLEHRRHLLILKQQGLTPNTTNTDIDTTSLDLVSVEKLRAPAVLPGAKSEYFPPPPSTTATPPTPPLLLPSTPSFSPETLYADLLLSTAGVTSKPTVQSVPGLVVYDGDFVRDNYADEYEGARSGAGARKESDLEQEMVEPMCGPSPTLNSAISDLVYVPSPNVGMDWIRQQQPNHPHVVVSSSSPSQSPPWISVQPKMALYLQNLIRDQSVYSDERIKLDDLYKDTLYIDGRLLKSWSKTVGDYRIFGRVFTYRPHFKNDNAIYVNMIDDGETIAFIILLNQKVERIMEAIYVRTGIDCSNQCLFYKGYRLDPDCTLDESKVHLGSTIHFLRSLGGRPDNLIPFKDILDAPGASSGELTRTGHPGLYISRGTYVEYRCVCSPDRVMVDPKYYETHELLGSEIHCYQCHQTDMVVPVSVGFVECWYRFFGIRKTGEQVSSTWKDTEDNQYTRLGSVEMLMGWSRLIVESAALHERDRCSICLDKVYACLNEHLTNVLQY
ncbi:hypothetical protein BG015_011967 [Linnemannia schmuckeri]|uniref:Ubiquitin-like domain-containing protein n=1 Tax=Linnemannia schmuckeri TaxID=64567 RepID=A0A9P5VE53_9FUNG|nr:hypothetical protein BG015_011967 [Linnemannia schmuckeri]